MEAHERIKDTLARFGVSKAALAERAGVHQNTLRKVERDDWNAGLQIVKKVAAAADAIRAERT